MSITYIKFAKLNNSTAHSRNPARTEYCAIFRENICFWHMPRSKYFHLRFFGISGITGYFTLALTGSPAFRKSFL